MIALNYALAMAGAPHGIACNGIVPLAWTDAAARTSVDSPMMAMMKTMRSEHVAPVVAYLAHEDCNVSGEEILAMGGRAQRYDYHPTREGDDMMAAMMSGGYTNPDLTLEDVRDHWPEILGDDYRPLVFPDEAAMGGQAKPYVPTS
jgi:hypothetical protein